MRGISISLVGMLLLGPFAGGSPLRADEAYVCEGGRVAYVRFGELEAMKRKDPCIAAYHGDRVAAEPTAAADAGEIVDGANSVEEPLAVVLVAGGGTRPASAPVLKLGPRPARRSQSATTVATAGSAKVAASGGTSGRVVERAPAPPPVPHPETDFRNVRVLNASPGESGIYRHDR